MRKHNPKEQHIHSNASVKAYSSAMCETKSRIILTNSEGMSVTSCPLSYNSAQEHNVEIFSSGWHDQLNFNEPNMPRSISVEYINPDHEDYSFVWLEMAPRPPLGLVGKLTLCSYF